MPARESGVAPAAGESKAGMFPEPTPALAGGIMELAAPQLLASTVPVSNCGVELDAPVELVKAFEGIVQFEVELSLKGVTPLMFAAPEVSTPA